MPAPVSPPGPPPQNYRPPGQGAPGAWGTAAWPANESLGNRASATPAPPRSGVSPIGTAAIAVATLLLGVVVGFFIGRDTPDDSPTGAAPPLTSPSTTATTRPPGDTVPQNPTPPPDPSAPSTTAPQVDIAPTTIGSLDDPIPVGQAYIFGLYEITVLDADRDATATLDAAGGPPPPAGSDHLLVRVRVRYTDDGFGRAAAIPFFVSDGTTQWDDISSSCGSVPESILDAGPIEEGEETVGNTCFTVPSEQLDTVVFGTVGFDGPVYFALP